MAIKYNFARHYDEPESMNFPVLDVEMWRIQNSKYGNISVRPCYIRPRDGVEYLDFYGDYFSSGEYIFNNLCLTAQFDWLDKEEDRSPYAIRLGYRDESAFNISDFEKLQGRMKFLTKIYKSFDRMEAKELNQTNTVSRNYEDYVYRLALTLGINFFVVRTSNNYPYTFRRIPVEDIRRVLQEAYQTNFIGQ